MRIMITIIMRSKMERVIVRMKMIKRNRMIRMNKRNKMEIRQVNVRMKQINNKREISLMIVPTIRIKIVPQVIKINKINQITVQMMNALGIIKLVKINKLLILINCQNSNQKRMILGMVTWISNTTNKKKSTNKK